MRERPEKGLVPIIKTLFIAGAIAASVALINNSNEVYQRVEQIRYETQTFNKNAKWHNYVGSLTLSVLLGGMSIYSSKIRD